MTVPTEQALELWHELMEHTPRGDATPNLQPDGCKYVGHVALSVGVAAALRKVLSLDGYAELLARVVPDGWAPDGTEVMVRFVRGTPQLEADGMVLVAVQGTISRIPQHALMVAPRAAAGAFITSGEDNDT